VVLGKERVRAYPAREEGIGAQRPLYARLRSSRNDPVTEKEGMTWRGICPAN
jgi:hypothetical protein